jgi:hypothetical protein
MHPQFEDEEAVNPFDFWEGANFRLRIRNVEGYRNYDKSAFDEPSTLLDDDEEMEKIWKLQNGLSEFLDENNFRSYEELSQKLAKVLGENNRQTSATAEDVPEIEYTAPVAEATSAPAEPTPTFEDDDDSLDFFKKLAED